MIIAMIMSEMVSLTDVRVVGYDDRRQKSTGRKATDLVATRPSGLSLGPSRIPKSIPYISRYRHFGLIY